MGFYSASQLIQDAKRQQLHILPVCIQHSIWDHQIEQRPTSNNLCASDGQPNRALRLGFRQIKGFNQHRCQQLIANRPTAGFANLAQLTHGGVRKDDLALLASSGALQLLAGHRYQSRWQLQDSLTDLPLFAAVTQPTATYQDSQQLDLLGLLARDASAVEAAVETAVTARVTAKVPQEPACPSSQQTTLAKPATAAEFCLPAPSAIDDLIEDYTRLGLSLNQHPMALLRQAGLPGKIKTAQQLATLSNKSPVQVAGLVTARQSPCTAAGVTFVTLEDETGNINLLVWQATAMAQKMPFLTARILWVHGMLQREGDVIHIIAGQLQSLDHLLAPLQNKVRNFH
jgi:error-prone DNA polymerase